MLRLEILMSAKIHAIGVMNLVRKTSRFSATWQHGMILALAFFAFMMSGVISKGVFERLPHLEDELAYQYQAHIFAGGSLVVPSPEPRMAFWQPFVVDDTETGNRFGKYTPGWPLLLALGVLLQQMWLINAFFSLLTVALVYRIGAEMYTGETGVIAALLVAFSPAALLLNGTLMGHTAALFFTTAFIYTYWRVVHASGLFWAVLAGFALGALATIRPLTSVAIGLPYIVWSIARLIHSFRVFPSFALLIREMTPLLMLSICALLLASFIPLFNYAATGDFTQNLYELVWDYDRVGFGECCGRNGHTLKKAFLHARFDLSLAASDLFGWQFAPITPELEAHLQTEADYWPATGYSFLFLLPGILFGLNAGQHRKRAVLLLFWGIVACGWCLFPLHLDTSIFGTSLAEILYLNPDVILDSMFSWGWVLFGLVWLLVPLFFWVQHSQQTAQTWVFTSIVLGIILVQMTYWIGSQRYSTRYYFEALTAVALLSALPIGWLARRLSGKVIISFMLIFSLFSFYFYSWPRIMTLYRFNYVSAEVLEQINDRRSTEQPLLVIINGVASGEDRVRWRSYGTLMAVTDPYFESDIIGVRDFGTGDMRQQILARFPDREIIEVQAAGNEWRFLDD